MRTNKKIFSFDWISFFLFLLLIAFGSLNIYSVDPARLQKQMIWIGISFTIGFVIIYTKKYVFKDFSILTYLGSILLLAGLFVIGKEINGAKSWYAIGSLTIQPTEFAKYGTILFMSNFLSQHETKISDFKTLLQALLILGIPAGLITLQPDPGSALVYGAFILVFYREGLNIIYLILISLIITLFVLSRVFDSFLLISYLFALGMILNALLNKSMQSRYEYNKKNKRTISIFIVAIGVPILLYYLEATPLVQLIIMFVLWSVNFIFILTKNNKIAKHAKNQFIISGLVLAFVGFTFATNYIFNNILKDRHRNRFDIIIKGEQIDPKGIGFNLLQAKTAIGSGGLTGKGFLKGTYTKGKHVPEQSTDYIFCTVGEEWGFVGAVTLILVYSLFIGRIFSISNKSEDTFTRIFGFSIASVFLFHFFINIGMVIGLIPTIGIPLPFFSYGGSSLLGFCLLFFTFLSITMQDNQDKLY